MIETPHGDDAPRRVPVYSLYSETREPTAEMLRGRRRAGHRPAGHRRAHLHLHLHDGQLPARRARGTASRSSSATGRIRSAATTSKARRSMPGYESFVGQFPIPMRHGMTIGELARLFNDALRHRRAARGRPRWKAGRATCMPTRTGLPWVMPSPNMPTLDTAIVYPGTVLFEGTMLSEGRGTTRPFELVGAPWIDAERFAGEMNALRLPGVYFRPAVFEPTFQKHAKQPCGGVPDSRAPTATPSSRCITGVALIDMFRAARSQAASPGGSRHTNTSTTRCRSTSSPGSRRRCGEQIEIGHADPRRSPEAGRTTRRVPSGCAQPYPDCSRRSLSGIG